MKIFKVIKNLYADFGVYEPHSFDKFHSYNLRNVVIAFMFCVTVIMTGGAFFFNSKTIFEYAHALYGILASILSLFLFGVIVWKTTNIYKLIKKFETMIQARKLFWIVSKKSLRSNIWFTE